MEGVQSAAEIENGNFDAQQHFKAMLMYQEMFLSISLSTSLGLS